MYSPFQFRFFDSDSRIDFIEESIGIENRLKESVKESESKGIGKSGIGSTLIKSILLKFSLISGFHVSETCESFYDESAEVSERMNNSFSGL